MVFEKTFRPLFYLWLDREQYYALEASKLLYGCLMKYI